jgi:tellurite methyltransferase
MLRKILCFHQDQEQHWVADLSCGHSQHTRHKPPLVVRPWVLTPEGRESMIGSELNCVRCDRKEIPNRAASIKRTNVFTQENIPPAIRTSHQTAPGIWGRITVLNGRLTYTIFEPFNEDLDLNSNCSGVIVPEVSHSVNPVGSDDVEFYIEFLKVPS